MLGQAGHFDDRDKTMKPEHIAEYLEDSEADSTLAAGMMIADGLHLIADALRRLGTGNASTGGWGAIEAHSKSVEDGLQSVASAIASLADYLRASNGE